MILDHLLWSVGSSNLSSEKKGPLIFCTHASAKCYSCCLNYACINNHAHVNNPTAHM